jgi:hypothetical protein
MLKFSKNIFLKGKKKLWKEKEAFFGMFHKYFIVENFESWKLNNYSSETWQTCYSTMVVKTEVNLINMVVR